MTRLVPVWQVTAQATCRVSRTPLALNMGMRDTLKKAVGTVAAGIRSALPAHLRSLHARSAESEILSSALNPPVGVLMNVLINRIVQRLE